MSTLIHGAATHCILVHPVQVKSLALARKTKARVGMGEARGQSENGPEEKEVQDEHHALGAIYEDE